MARKNVRRAAWTALGIAFVGPLAWLMRPAPLLVEAASVTRGSLRSAVTGEGRARVKALYTVTAPVDGELERILLEPGTALSSETLVARIRPVTSRPLDARSRAEATAAAAAAREAVSRVDAAEREARVAVEHTESKLARTKKLAESGSVPQADLEHAGHEVQMAKEGLESARAAARQARAELARATAVITPESRTSVAPAVEVKSPARGQILRVLRESAGPVAAGTPLVEVGDVSELEIVADLLSKDAASVRAQEPATVSGWGDGGSLAARVRRVDPAGFTKVSALGLEEQRVRVVLDLMGPPPKGLGHDYRVDVAIVVWEGKDVLRVPSTALFRDRDRWAAFVVRDGRARLTNVDTGVSDSTLTLVKSGVAVGDRVIQQPSDAIVEGTRVDVLRYVSP